MVLVKRYKKRDINGSLLWKAKLTKRLRCYFLNDFVMFD
jgi:hypothetical protein